MPTATLTAAPAAALPLVRGRPWMLPATWRNPAAAGQAPNSGSVIDLTGAAVICSVSWSRGSIDCAVAPLDDTGTILASLTPAQTAAIPAGVAQANLTIVDTSANTYDFQLGLQVLTP